MARSWDRCLRLALCHLRNREDAVDEVQTAYWKAYTHLNSFSEEAKFSTWVARIALHEALARLRQRGRFVSMARVSEDDMANIPSVSPGDDPERAAAGHEMGQMVEQAVDGLPEIYRAVLILREVEGMSTTETAAVLSVEPEVVKTRLHRARTALRVAVERRMGEQMKTAYTFGNERCDHIVAVVLARLPHPPH
jgi:RNA polymerase sigma-70 factor (ECF subfamily)